MVIIKNNLISLGLGNSGEAMFRNLSRTHRAIGYDKDPETVARLKASGFMMSKTLESLTKKTTNFILVLPDSNEVKIVCEENGLF